MTTKNTRVVSIDEFNAMYNVEDVEKRKICLRKISAELKAAVAECDKERFEAGCINGLDPYSDDVEAVHGKSGFLIGLRYRNKDMRPTKIWGIGDD